MLRICWLACLCTLGRLGIPDHECCTRTVDGDGIVLKPRTVRATAGANVTFVACGSGHCLCLLAGGSLLAWGRNDSGQLGVAARQNEVSQDFTLRMPHLPDQWIPVHVLLPAPVVSAACSAYQSCCLTTDNELFVWGRLAGESSVVALPTKITNGLPPPPLQLVAGDLPAVLAGQTLLFAISTVRLGAVPFDFNIAQASTSLVLADTGRLLTPDTSFLPGW